MTTECALCKRTIPIRDMRPVSYWHGPMHCTGMRCKSCVTRFGAHMGYYEAKAILNRDPK